MSVLDEIVAGVREDLAVREAQVPLDELKRRVPDTRKVSVLAEENLPYQTLVSVLDKVRGYPTRRDGAVVQAELFPEIALGDAPAPGPAGEGEHAT